ncbi:hypothetical protein GCM10027059_50230 [Myceligenerans halotolerans]
MNVIAMIDTREGIAGREPSQAQEITTDADTYEEGKTALATEVPDGWQILSYRVPGR